MYSFPIIATVLSMVLGLSVTRLLLGLVTVFRIRDTAPIDWVPLAWSGILFLFQLQFWWAINQLPSLRESFDFGEFVFLVLLTLMLFLSAALLLPSRSEDEKDGLRAYFEKDGRYALMSLAIFLILAAIANMTFYKEPALGEWSLLDVPMIILPVAAFLSRKRRIYAVITALYLPLAAFDTWVSLMS